MLYDVIGTSFGKGAARTAT